MTDAVDCLVFSAFLATLLWAFIAEPPNAS
jgi:hypothetical protein